MSVMEKKLQPLAEELIKGVREYGILEVSIGQYQTVCKSFMRYAALTGEDSYTKDLCDRYLAYLDEQVDDQKICTMYRRFQRRVIRMLTSLAENGEIDFSHAKQTVQKYPVPEYITVLVEDILDSYPISQKTRSDLRAPVRHIFWYALQQGIEPNCIGDSLLMEFLIHEVPVTNSGSTGRTLRCVKYVSEYLKSHGNSAIKHDYTVLKLKNDHRRIIPAFSEEEISEISLAASSDTLIGKRDLAVILLAYCTGLRGADIIRLRLSDVDWKSQKLSIVQSKTYTQITAELNGQTMNALADYILDARPKCSAAELFVTSRAPYRSLSSGFGKMIDKYCERAGVRKINMRAFHSLRRSFETVLVTKGVPIEIASQMMGHKTIIEDKPYITHDKSKVAFVAIDFAEVPITSGFYARRENDVHPVNGGDGV